MFSALAKLVVFLIITLFVVPSIATVYAQDRAVQGAGTLGVARMVDVKEKNVKNGHIISSSPQGNVLSNIPYDSQVVGVVSRDAGIILNNSASANGIPVISTGTVYVLVSNKEGDIKKGDTITTSTIPGVGVKAVKDGYVLGTALEDFNSGKPGETGIIAAEFNLSYSNAKPTFPGSLTDILKFAILPTKEGPTPMFKYIVSGLVVLASFVLAFMTFGRTAAKGVEALGRNPAASRIIHLGIIFNVGIVVIIVVAGMTVSFLILRL